MVRRTDYITKRDLQLIKDTTKNITREGKTIRVYFYSRAISANVGGLNPVTNTPVRPFATGGDSSYDPWDETITSAILTGKVRWMDSTQAWRIFSHMGEYEPGMVEIITPYDDTFNSDGENIFLTAEYFTVGDDRLDEYVSRFSEPDDLKTLVKTIAKKRKDLSAG